MKKYIYALIDLLGISILLNLAGMFSGHLVGLFFLIIGIIWLETRLSQRIMIKEAYEKLQHYVKKYYGKE
jgi:hypothetical protein